MKNRLVQQRLKEAVEGGPGGQGALERFERWISGSGDLWHPAFPSMFADCLSELVPAGDFEHFEQLGEIISDNEHGFFDEQMQALAAFLNANPDVLQQSPEEVYQSFISQSK